MMLDLIPIINAALLIIGLMIAIPVLVLFVQVISSLLYRSELLDNEVHQELSIAILIPAHNEEELIANTLKPLSEFGKANHHIVVVADNCTDRTGEIALRYNANVVERNNQELKGKGYALDAGLDYLKNLSDRPDVVVIIDADCEISSDDIYLLSVKSINLSRPVQALYLMKSLPNNSIRQRMAELAWCVKNHVRPKGYYMMGFPCQLMGTGMAFPWKVLSTRTLATSSIVEDLELGLELAETKQSAIFYPEVRVISYFPDSDSSAYNQRKRWEHGHLGLIAKIPKLLFNGILNRNLDLIALSIDLSVPPLTLFLFLCLIYFFVSLVFSLMTGLVFALYLSIAFIVLLIISVTVAWLRFAPDIIRLLDFIYLPVYMLKKLPIYFIYLFSKERSWKRTSRSEKKL
jgi:glycosyltransferase involved in cell wall biosynthesis